MKARIVLNFFLFFLIIAATSCKNSSNSGANDSGNLMDQMADKEKAVETVIGYPIPTSYEVVKLLNDAGAPFNIGIVNPASNVNSYVSTKEKALNLGIYGADLSYASAYNYTQSVREYLNASIKLIDELQIASSFNEEFSEKVEANIDNKDTLISLITDSFYDTYQYLRKNEQDISSVLVVAGSWIESVYIASQIYITSQEKDPFVTILNNQKTSLSKLLKLLEPVKDDANVAEIYSGLKEIEVIYKEFGSPVSPEQINKLALQMEEFRGGLI